MLSQILIVSVCFLLLNTFYTISEGASTSGKDPAKADEKRIQKRGYFGELNEYGPEAHISSSVLQLEDTPDFGFNQHIEGIQGNSGESIWKESPIWNNDASDYQPSHEFLDTSNHEHIHQSSLGESSFSHGLSNGYSGSHGGLHTQIISSSGLDISSLSDKLDTNNDFGENGKHYIKSYG